MKACVVISDKNFERAKKQLSGIDLAEIRMDKCQWTKDEYREALSMNKEFILTYRTIENNDLDKKINSIKLGIELGATYVDIEYELEETIQKSIIALAIQHGVKIIISYHNFQNTDVLEKLNYIVERSFSKEADIVKLATTSQGSEDNKNVLSLYQRYKNIVAFCMGKNAKQTRLLSLNLGAPFAYVYMGENPNIAEGMPSLDELNKFLDDQKYL